MAENLRGESLWSKVSVKDALPDKGFKSSYMCLITRPVVLFGTWREDYPIVGHFVLETNNDSMGCNLGIPFAHPDGYRFYSARCAYIRDLGVLGTKWRNWLPVALTMAVHYWAYIPGYGYEE